MRSEPATSIPHNSPGPVPCALERLEDRLLLSLNPTAFEQEMLEWINRMRTDPAAHWDDLFTSANPLVATDPDVQSAVDYFHVSGTTLQAQWSALSAAPPLAWHEALVTAARNHSQLMITLNMQEHQLPGEDELSVRVTNAGYVWQYSVTWGENVYAYGESVFQAHAGFAVDWGTNPPTGIQDPPGHRDNIMSTNFREIGVGILIDTVPGGVGTFVVTEDFGSRGNIGDPYLLGTVRDDSDGNGLYNAGEQLGGVTVRVLDALDQQVALLTTMTAGGYQTQLPAGTYTVQFYGGALGGTVEKGVTIGSDNVKVDATAQEMVSPVSLTTPIHGAQVAGGQSVAVQWSGGQAGTTLDLWRLGADGWTRETTGTPAANGQHSWDTTGRPAGLHTFAARVHNGPPGQGDPIYAPDWVTVTSVSAPPPAPSGGGGDHVVRAPLSAVGLQAAPLHFRATVPPRADDGEGRARAETASLTSASLSHLPAVAASPIVLRADDTAAEPVESITPAGTLAAPPPAPPRVGSEELTEEWPLLASPEEILGE